MTGAKKSVAAVAKWERNLRADLFGSVSIEPILGAGDGREE
jgi:hypothetical protein